MRRFLLTLLGGRLQVVLIASFALVAALTVGLSTVVISRVINDYLAAAEDERVARDMDLADAFYQLKLDEVAAIGYRLVRDPWVIQNLPAAEQGQAEAIQIIDQQITNKIAVLALGGTHLIAVLDPEGNILLGRVLSPGRIVAGHYSRQLEPFADRRNRVIVSDSPGSHRGHPGRILGSGRAGQAGLHPTKRNPQGSPRTLRPP